MLQEEPRACSWWASAGSGAQARLSAATAGPEPASPQSARRPAPYWAAKRPPLEGSSCSEAASSCEIRLETLFTNYTDTDIVLTRSLSLSLRIPYGLPIAIAGRPSSARVLVDDLVRLVALKREQRLLSARLFEALEWNGCTRRRAQIVSWIIN